MDTTTSLHAQVIDISRDYLGPAAERFIERQVSTHLHKEPDELTKPDLVKLIDWIKLAFALLTNDPGVVDEYTSRLQGLVKAYTAKSETAP